MQREINIHVGEIICQKIKEEGRTKTWLAKQVGCDRSNLSKALKNSYICTRLLMRISTALQCNFLEILALHYNEKRQNI